MKPTLVIMAAGMGSRYGGLKQIDPVGPNGEIIIDYSIHDAVLAGFGKAVFIIRKDIEKEFRACVGKRIEKKIDTQYCFQSLQGLPQGFTVPDGRVKPWGTGQAVLSAKDAVCEPFAVINADDFYGREAYAAMSDFLVNACDKPGCCDYSMVGYVLGNTLTENGHVSRGICETENGYLKKITERKMIRKFDDKIKFEENEQWYDLTGNETVSMNFWGFTPSMFDELERNFPEFLKDNINVPKSEYLLPAQVGEMVNEQRATVKVLTSDARWYGVTYAEDKAAVQQSIIQMIKDGKYPQEL